MVNSSPSTLKNPGASHPVTKTLHTWRELLPAGSSRAYHVEPPLAPGIIAHFKLDDYKTFQESSRWLHQQHGCTRAACWFPSRKNRVTGSVASSQLTSLNGKVNRSFLLHKQKASVRHITLLCGEPTSLGGFSRYRYWLSESSSTV